MFKGLRKAVLNAALVAALVAAGIGGFKFFHEYLTFKKIIRNLEAESRLAEVLVVESSLDEYTRKYTTTIKFLEYDVKGRPLQPKYFTFKGNLIQFQTLVVRFDDKYVEQGHRMRGKSIHLFLKAFVLDGANTQEFLITAPGRVPHGEEPRGGVPFVRLFDGLFAKAGPGRAPLPESIVPEGYRVGDPPNYFEREIWARFWKIALEPAERERVGIKNAQVEAPGSVFVPGTIYTLLLENDGGVRIDTRPIPEILKGEKVR
ncbi:MAG TPA: hypothetical protein VL404_01815 [Candidatus Eisenbacteria bacterium]|nr:hypothetical protein [Candidatus Eisenbacteria bacterium]